MRVFVTGSAGFIGFHVCNSLLNEGHIVHGYDGMTDYYDVSLKNKRHSFLKSDSNFTCTEAMLEDKVSLEMAVGFFEPDVIIHLAAQAGVRYSLENPESYISSNVVGTFNIMEVSKRFNIGHLLVASTSSVYGNSTDMPFREDSKTDSPLTIYAATKKSTEVLLHSYASLWHVPTTVFRFFTVYGPWGRPDMALFKFTEAIMNGEPIDVYNNGEMYRDFTYVDDLVKSIVMLIPEKPLQETPYRVINIGRSNSIKLSDFIAVIEKHLGIEAKKNFMELQKGDPVKTWADSSKLESLINYKPDTDIDYGVKEFLKWYKKYYGRTMND